MWAEPTNTALRVRERLSPPGFELRSPAHRVLELRAMGLDRKACTGGDPDRPAEENVVAEHEIRGKPRAERGAIRLDPALELLPRAVLHELDLVPLVAVEDEDRQEPPDIGPDDLRGSEIVRVGMRVLAEDGDVMPRPRPLPGELARVDVRPRSSEQVPVPEQDAHRRIIAQCGAAACFTPRKHASGTHEGSAVARAESPLGDSLLRKVRWK